MRNILFILFIGISFFTCTPDESTSKQPNTTIVEEKKPEVKTSIVTPSFLINSYKDAMETPMSKISLDMDGKNIPVTDEGVIGCEKIVASDYEKYQIPKEAVDACGGWWAGGGNYYYIIRNEESSYWMIMQALVDEGQTGKTYDYQSIMNITYVLK